MIAGAESTIAGAELMAVGGRGPPQKYTNWHQCTEVVTEVGKPNRGWDGSSDINR